MKLQIVLIATMMIGICYITPRLLNRDPEDANIPFRVKFLSYIGQNLLAGAVPPSWIRWIQASKVPSPSNKYDVTYEQMVNDDGSSFQTIIYTPKGLSKDVLEKLDIMLYFHGGGFMVGHPHAYHYFFNEVLEKENLIIVSPDYRKLPEYSVDTCIFDSIQTLRWIKKKYGNRNLIMAGDSAGGKIVLSISQYLQRTNYEDYEKSNLFLVPIYTVFCGEWRNFSKECRKDSNFKNGYLTNEKLVTDLHGSKIIEKRKLVEYFFDPEEMDNLPDMLIITAEYDYLRDEAKDWYERINMKYPDNYEYVMIEGEIHGFIDKMFAIEVSSISKVIDVILSSSLRK